MSDLSNKVSYLQGMAAGMKLNPDKDSHKLILKMLSLMGEIANAVDESTVAIEDLDDRVDSLESEGDYNWFSDDDDDDDDFDDFDDFYGDDSEEDDTEEPEEDDNPLMVEYVCPNCGRVLHIDASKIDLKAPSPCPGCGKPLFTEITPLSPEDLFLNKIRVSVDEDDNEGEGFNPFGSIHM